MKHVVTGAPNRQTVLVTGFGAFPGVPRNPTLAVLAGLERHRPRLARLGIALRCVALPVVYAAIAPALRASVADGRPDVILHLGLAGRRRAVGVETRAVNRASSLHPDAAGQQPMGCLVVGAPQILRATYPVTRVCAAMARAGLDARLSIDAGDYVCNATLFRSLAADLAPCIGFVHVPKVRSRLPSGRSRYRRPTVDDLVAGVLAALMVL